MVLSPKSTLSSCAGNCSLKELLLAVEEDVLVAGNDVNALPAQPADWVLVEGHHRHPEVHLPASVVEIAVPHHGVCLPLGFLINLFNIIIKKFGSAPPSICIRETFFLRVKNWSLQLLTFAFYTFYTWILPLKKRVNRDKCSFATKQRMFGVFAMDEILCYRWAPLVGSRTLCHPACYWGLSFHFI